MSKHNLAAQAYEDRRRAVARAESLMREAQAVATETGLTPRQLADQRAELLRLLTLIKEACLFDDDNGRTGVTEEPHIPASLFNQICAAVANAEK